MCEKEKLFLELIEGFQWKYDLEECPDSLFVFKDNECIFEIWSAKSINQKKIISSYRLRIYQVLKKDDVWFDNSKLWSIFKSKFEMEHGDIESFIEEMIEKHFKIRAIDNSPR